MTASAQGIDISSFQAVYTVAELERYSFAFFRATLGTTNTDPNFSSNWANAKTAKIHRGAYHELTNLSDVSTQSAHFIATVKARGVEPGDMLACVATDYPVSSASVKAFCTAVKAEFPTSPVLIYSDVSELANWSAEAAEFPLWVAWYENAAPASVAPWKTWTLWQWSDSPVDQDAFNGTAEELQTWLDSVAYPLPPDPDAWVFGSPRSLKVTPGHTSVRLEIESPAVVKPLPVAYYEVAIRLPGQTGVIASYPRDVPKGDTVTTSWQGGSLAEKTTYEVLVRACASGSDTHASPWITATFTTGS